MSTGEGGRGKDAQFSEEELAAVAEGPAGDADLDGVDPAEIDDRSADSDIPFDKLALKGRRLSADRLRAVIQSLLFVSDKPLTLDQLYESTAFDRAAIERALAELVAVHADRAFGIVLHEVGGAYQLRTAPQCAEYVRRYLKVKPQRLTRSALETLAIIAYRQPVTRPEIEDIRGVDSGAVLKALLERKLVKILGKKEEPGRPIVYGTTREFLEFFALRDLSSLPTLKEFQELTREHQEIVEREAPEPKPSVSGTVEALADPSFTQRLEATQVDSEAALEKLEAAMSEAERTAKAAAAALAPVQPPADETGSQPT